MSQDHPVALLGPAEFATYGSHDTAEVQLGGPELNDRLTTSRQAMQAVNSQTSQHLESPQEDSGSGSTVCSSPPSLSGKLGDVEARNHDKEEQKSESCVTRLAPDRLQLSTCADSLDEENHDSAVGPPPLLVPPTPRDTLPHALSPTTPLTPTAQSDFSFRAYSQYHQTFPHVSLHKTTDGAANSYDGPHEDNMIFGQHPAAIAARRRSYANSTALTQYEADLTSRDRAKQKEAVKKYLGERVRQDWAFEWPKSDLGPSVEQPTPSPQLPDSILSLNLEDSTIAEEQWKERDEWLSNASESGDEKPIPTSATSPDTPSTRNSTFQFESPDSVGDTIQKLQYERKRRRKRRLADEMNWNNGLRCFTARRDAWTGARRVPRSKLRPSTSETRRGSLPVEGFTEVDYDEDEGWEDDIEIPIAPPILPPENAMRASIQPGAYNTIYDKVIVQQLTPSCPMNLKDVTRSCVQGWKRDGEWPPKPTFPEPKRKGRKMSVASLFGLERQKTQEEKPKEKQTQEISSHPEAEKKPSGIRRSIQRILNLGHKESKDPHTNGDGAADKEMVAAEN